MNADPLVGSWTYRGQVPAFVALTLTFRADKTFMFVEQVAPPSQPAGQDVGGCVTTDVYHGVYTQARADGDDVLMWTFVDGTTNQISECEEPSNDSSGTPLTAEGVESYIAQGLIPPMQVSYRVSSTLLTITSAGDGAGIGAGAGTSFVKNP